MWGDPLTHTHTHTLSLSLSLSLSLTHTHHPSLRQYIQTVCPQPFQGPTLFAPVVKIPWLVCVCVCVCVCLRLHESRKRQQAHDVRHSQIQDQTQGEVVLLEVAEYHHHNHYVPRHAKKKAQPQHCAAHLVCHRDGSHA